MAALNGHGSQIILGSLSLANPYRPRIAFSDFLRLAGSVDKPILIHLSTNSGKRASCSLVIFIILDIDLILVVRAGMLDVKRVFIGMV
jgi:hypothetical protein